MLNNNYTEKLLDLKGVILIDATHSVDKVDLYLETILKEQTCPNCDTKTKNIHDYRTQIVKDTRLGGKPCFLHIKKRRYTCPTCSSHITEKLDFVAENHRITKRLVASIINKLSRSVSFTSVAKEFGVSVNSVIRFFKPINYESKQLPEVLSIDEFKGNVGMNKYQVIITNPVTKEVVDILPCRLKGDLIKYFSKFDCSKVKYFVSDMWSPYRSIAKELFKNATFIVDRFHIVQQVVRAFDTVRRETQATLSKKVRLNFKHARKTLIARYSSLSDRGKYLVNTLLDNSEKLREAYTFKEHFYKMLDNYNDMYSFKTDLEDWCRLAYNSNLKPFVSCANTFRNWKKGIINATLHPYSNGFTEGCNMKIKNLKRSGFGYRNFERFRARILHIFS